MISINPYINFNGNAEEAFTFYKSVFGGEFTSLSHMGEFPNPEFPIPEEDKSKIMHIALPIGATVLMGNDVPSFMGKTNERENRSKISVQVETKAEADRIFTGLAAGGEVEIPMADAPWGSYFGMFRDKYGIEWMINCASVA